MDPREQLIQLSADRTQYLTAAENALQGGDQAAFDTAMERVRNINGQIENVQALVREQALLWVLRERAWVLRGREREPLRLPPLSPRVCRLALHSDRAERARSSPYP